MSHYEALTDEEKIKIARDAVSCGIPIAPTIVTWLHINGLYERVTNPRKTHAENEPETG